MNDVIWYLSFSNLLILLTIIPSSSMHMVANGKISFFLIAKKYSILCMCTHTHHIFFTHSSGDGHLGSFHTLAIVDSAAINIGVHVPLQNSIPVSLGKYLLVQLLGHREVLFLIFWGNSMLLSRVIAPVCIPTSSAKEILFLHILTNICCCLSC